MYLHIIPTLRGIRYIYISQTCTYADILPILDACKAIIGHKAHLVLFMGLRTWARNPKQPLYILMSIRRYTITLFRTYSIYVHFQQKHYPIKVSSFASLRLCKRSHPAFENEWMFLVWALDNFATYMRKHHLTKQHVSTRGRRGKGREGNNSNF